jgi:histone H3/H4
MQKSTNLIISRLWFDRIARNILYDIDATFRIKRSVMQALQKAAKAMFTTELKNKFNQSRLI